MEIARLRAELARVKMERDILGKATAYFAKLRHEVAYIIVSPAHKVGAETGCSVIRARHKRRFKATTDSKHSMPVAANLLARNFTPPAPNKVWTGDIRT
jgi:transposase InsO family protein